MPKKMDGITLARVQADQDDLVEVIELWRNPKRRAAFEAAQANRERHRDPFATHPPQRVRVRAGTPEVWVTVNGITGYWWVLEAKTHLVLLPLTPSPRGNEAVNAIQIPNGTWILPQGLSAWPFDTP